MNYTGRCLCGGIELQVTGVPVSMGYCHCATCRSWSAGPITAFTIWTAEAVAVTCGVEYVGTYKKTERSQRKFCKRCGGHVMLAVPTLDLVNVFATTVPTFAFRPTLHVNYAETILPTRDGLPKWKDFPAEFGGSGQLLPE
jgi:hypothetical protein